MRLTEPTSKMGKSDEDASGCVYLLDPPDLIRKKFARPTTDSARTIVFDENRSGIYNLLTIYELFAGESRAAIEQRFAGNGYGDFKYDLAEVVIEGLRPLQAREPDHTLRDVQIAMGIR